MLLYPNGEYIPLHPADVIKQIGGAEGIAWEIVTIIFWQSLND